MHPAVFLLASDQSENLLGEGDDNAACHSEHAVGTLGGIVTLEGQTHLQDAEAQQDEADSADQGKYKITQIVDHRQRIVRGQRRDSGDHHHHDRAGKDGVEPLCLSFEVLGFQIVFHYAAFSFSLL